MADVEALKRCIRFLLKYPRCIQSFERQEVVPEQITCHSDSKFAGCLQSRKSTSSCKIFCWKHLLKSTSTTQAVVSLSSAEAEFYAAVKAAAAGIGCVSMNGHTLEVLWNAFCRRSESDCTPIGALDGN